MTPSERRFRHRIKSEDAAMYRRFARECPVRPWADEYDQIAKRLEAEAAALAQEKETVQ